MSKFKKFIIRGLEGIIEGDDGSFTYFTCDAAELVEHIVNTDDDFYFSSYQPPKVEYVLRPLLDKNGVAFKLRKM